MPKQLVLVVGEIFVDTHLDIIEQNGPLIRLGGIFHSARAFSALGVDYALAYYAPDFLEDDINYFSCLLNSKLCYRLGYINRAPNIMLVNESKECRNQGYYNILKDQAEYIKESNLTAVLNKLHPTDVLVFPGRYDIKQLMHELKYYDGKVHIDFHYDSDDILDAACFPVETVILSTSSEYFIKQCGASLQGIQEHFKLHSVNKFLVKENRGGSYCYVPTKENVYDAPAHYVPTMHSVGVGDVFNSVFISNIIEDDIEDSLRFSSLCASKYAETMSFEQYKKNVDTLRADLDNSLQIDGVRLSWEERSNKHIYLAAPDFLNVDTRVLGVLNQSLSYHNFCVHRPIKENGLATEGMTEAEEIRLYYKDIELINHCDLLIAVLLYNDPGTLVELGMFKQSGRPTIIFDPYDYCKNMFVRHTPDFLCKTIDDTLNSVFNCLRRKR